MAPGGRYSSGYFPRLSGSYGVGVSDVLHSLNGEEPLLVRLYYPTKRKTGDVPNSQLTKWMPKPYIKPFLIAGAHLPKVLATLLAPVMSLLTSEFS